MNTNIRVTHTDGDGFIQLGVELEAGPHKGTIDTVAMLTKEQALTLMANLAIAISDEYGESNSYLYPGCKAKRS